MIRHRLLAVVAAVLCLGGGTALAQSSEMDIRNVRVGLSVTDLPRQGYADFACAGRPDKPLARWDEFRTCAPDEKGSREVSFRYDDTPDHKTEVAGQPVLLSVVLDGNSVVEAIKMQTDPTGRLFVRKRGFMFGERVMAHYGGDGWSCSEGEPSASEQPVGNVFVREHCEKRLGPRQLVVDRRLFRAANQPLEAFTSATSVTISLVQPDAR